jgi:hypothetical protein
MSEYEKLTTKKSQKSSLDKNRISRASMVSPLMRMGAKGYSSDEESEFLS